MSYYTVFTRSNIDHSVVHIISSEIAYYDKANQLARSLAGSVMFTDQFMERFSPTTPNRMNGTLA